jgi:hypothetical protein
MPLQTVNASFLLASFLAKGSDAPSAEIGVLTVHVLPQDAGKGKKNNDQQTRPDRMMV